MWQRRSWLLIARFAVLGAAASLLVAPTPWQAVAATSETTVMVVDDVGRTVTLPYPVTRTIVLNRYVLEQVRAVGGMEVVVGVDAGPAKQDDYWPTIGDDMIVGQNQSNPNYEAIIAKAPQVVMMPRNAPWRDVASALEPFGIPVLVITAWDIETHEKNIELLGRIYGQGEKAAAFNAYFRHYRSLLRERLTDLPVRKRVYIEETRPNVTAIEGSGWHNMLVAAGAENIYGNVALFKDATGINPHHVEVDPEDLLHRDPEIIIKLQPGQYEPHPAAFSDEVLKGLLARPEIAGTTAARTRQIYHLSYYMASGSSKLTGALQIAKWLYPERLADIDPEAVMATWLETYQQVPAKSGYSRALRDIAP